MDGHSEQQFAAWGAMAPDAPGREVLVVSPRPERDHRLYDMLSAFGHTCSAWWPRGTADSPGHHVQTFHDPGDLPPTEVVVLGPLGSAEHADAAEAMIAAAEHPHVERLIIRSRRPAPCRTEDELRDRAEARGCSTVVLQYGEEYGDGNPGVFGLVLEDADTVESGHAPRLSPDQQFDPIHELDVAQAIALAVHQGHGRYEINGLGPTTVASLTEALVPHCAALGWALPDALRAGSPQRATSGPPGDSARASQDLGYSPRRDPDQDLPEFARAHIARRLRRRHPDGRRPFHAQGQWLKLDEAPSSRDRDLANHQVTLVRLEDGQSVIMTPQDLVPGYSSVRPHQPAHVGLRELCEDALDRGFDDRWLSVLISFAANQRMLRSSSDLDS